MRDIAHKVSPTVAYRVSALDAHKARLLRNLLREMSYRRIQGLNIYSPLPKQLDFHTCPAPERLALGGNRATKTTMCAVEVAWAVTGTHPYLEYPKRDGRCICVAKNGIKIGEVMYRKLFQSGAVKMIFDPKKEMYEPFKPWVHVGMEKYAKPALPLIPRRMIKSIAWEDKAQHFPKLITLTNGWEILFFTSAGKPIEGVDVDMCWFDEEIYEGWYGEMAARLIDRHGRFIWSATPQAATEQLFALHERAESERTKDDPRIVEFHLTMDDNPHIAEADKELFKEKLAGTEEEYAVRVRGEFLITSHFIYPAFKKTRHAVEEFDIPHDWCRYVVIDPGHAVNVALFFAVPPDKDERFAGHVYLYDELYTRQCDARMFAEQMRHKIEGQSFQAFLIDKHGSIRTESTGNTLGETYAQEFEKKGIRSIETGSNFILVGESGHQSYSPVTAGIAQVRLWLKNMEHDETPKLRVFWNRCPDFVREMGKYRFRRTNGKITDKPDAEYSHGPDCVRYAAQYGMPYVRPRALKAPKSNAMIRLANKRRKKRQEDGNYIILGSSRR